MHLFIKTKQNNENIKIICIANKHGEWNFLYTSRRYIKNSVLKFPLKVVGRKQCQRRK